MDIYIIDDDEYFNADMRQIIVRCAEIVLGYEGADKQTELTITFIDDLRMRELNNEYRNIDRATDVLSFPQDGPQPYLLGDIVISVETARRHALRYGVTLDEEILRLVVHGALHLLGYDHKKKSEREAMRARESELKAVIREKLER